MASQDLNCSAFEVLKDEVRIVTPTSFIFFLVFVTALYFTFFHHLEVRDFWSSHEARSAMDAISILDGTGSTIPKLFDGSEELQKPPLYYWMVAGISWLRGVQVDAISVRLPSAVAASSIIILIFTFLWANHSFISGIISSSLLLTCIHFGWLARIGRVDMALTFFITASVLAFYQAGQSEAGRKKLFLLFTYASLLIAILLKGLPALLLVLPLFASWIMVVVIRTRTRETVPDLLRKVFVLLQNYQAYVGLFVVLLLSGSYFFWINWQSEGKFFEVFFGYHHWTRAFGNGALRSHPPWFYFTQFFIDFAPWSPFFYCALVGVFCFKNYKLGSIQCFSLTWFLVMILILSLVSYKRADYLLPAYPGAAIFLGVLMADGFKLCLSKKLLTIKMFLPAQIALLTVSILGWIWFVDFHLPRLEPYREMKSAAKIIREKTPANLLFFNLESHALAFHTGKPLETVVGWGNLEQLVALNKESFVLTSLDNLPEISQKLPGFKFNVLYQKDIFKTKGLSRPFVFIKIYPVNET